MDEAKPKLLLADHSAAIRKVVELTFFDEGIEVTTASDAQSAMERFVEVQPDIVLVDVSLGGTNGYQICEMIKNDDATSHIPVLLLVGSFEPFDADEAERVRADGFLTKPFHSIRDLVVRVSDLLGRSDGGAAVLPAPAAALTGDIDHLYNSSFAETVSLDELDTADDLLGDAGMDDELIETTYPSEPLDDDILAFETTDEIPEADRSFDWSDEAVITDSEPIQKAQNSSVEPKFVFVEEGDHDFSQEETANAPTIENLSMAREMAEGGAVESANATVDNSSGNKIDELVEAADEVQDDTIENLAAEYHEAQNNTIENLPAVDGVRDNIGDPPEPSPELVELVAQRVIEKLSDQVVREIALDAVPRVAEKLIREALSQDKKK
ncbi:MAG TPA: response regulator [Pyrinomonadaceae bacterium]|nr:response regulator [Pyrinomonadaceae bacterium]